MEDHAILASIVCCLHFRTSAASHNFQMLMRRDVTCVSEILSVYLSPSSTYLTFNGHHHEKIGVSPWRGMWVEQDVDVIDAKLKLNNKFPSDHLPSLLICVCIWIAFSVIVRGTWLMNLPLSRDQAKQKRLIVCKPLENSPQSQILFRKGIKLKDSLTRFQLKNKKKTIKKV